MLRADMQFVLLGGGSQNYERAFRRLSERFPRKVSVNFGYNHSLAQRIEAGCDFYLMPSRFEPCGLNQMYSLRYGTIPIVRAVGGLDDTIVDASQEICSVNGIKFYEYSAAALAKAMRKALVIFEDAELLNFYRRNAMACDFAWAKTVRRYEEVYQLAGRVKRQCKATENLTQKVTTNFGG
jgi:starch synthase